MSLEGILNRLYISGVEVTWTLPERLRRVFTASADDSVMSQEELTKRLVNATESKGVEDLYLADINSDWGKALSWITEKIGHKPKLPDYYAWLDLPDKALAATIMLEDGTKLLAYNSKYREKLTSNSFMDRVNRLYVNSHEYFHICGVTSESYTDGFVADTAKYFREELLPKISDSMSELKRYFLEKITNLIEYTGRQRQAAQYGT